MGDTVRPWSYRAGMRTLLGVAVAIALLTSGCGQSSASASATSTANALKAAVPTATKVVRITPGNDPNNSIGRPASYTQAAVIFDSRTKCESKLDVSCGAKVEMFADATGAQQRKAYIEGIAKSAPGLIKEYDYVKGNEILRVSGNLKPGEAKAYESAFE